MGGLMRKLIEKLMAGGMGKFMGKLIPIE